MSLPLLDHRPVSLAFGADLRLPLQSQGDPPIEQFLQKPFQLDIRFGGAQYVQPAVAQGDRQALPLQTAAGVLEGSVDGGAAAAQEFHHRGKTILRQRVRRVGGQKFRRPQGKGGGHGLFRRSHRREFHKAVQGEPHRQPPVGLMKIHPADPRSR